MEKLEEDRYKLLVRLNGQEGNKCRPRLFFELAGIEARLGRPDDALYALRDAIANGLDIAYTDELKESAHFETLRDRSSFHSLVGAFEGKELAPFHYIYAKGEKERCDEALICSICTDPLVEPLVHDCGTLFCADCVSPLTQCPQCQGRTENLSKFTIRLMLNKLDTLRVHCMRCERVVERAGLNGHVEICPILCLHGCKTQDRAE
jgi:hypothetical protein